MGLKGRKRRLKNLKPRVESFDNFLWNKAEGRPESVPRNVIGEGTHKRLIKKRVGWHGRRAKQMEGDLLRLFEKRGRKPEKYVVVKVGFHAETGIQEYFSRPSIASLSLFLQGKTAGLTKRDFLLCRQFLGKYPVSAEGLEAAKKELFSDLADIGEIAQIPSNTVVVGRLKDGKFRFALVDV
jgi:hypothetical protein